MIHQNNFDSDTRVNAKTSLNETFLPVMLSQLETPPRPLVPINLLI